MGAGIYLWDIKKYEQAEFYFKQAINEKPDSLVAIYRLARNYHKLQNYEKMLGLYKKLLTEDSENMTYRIQYCELLIKLSY